MPTGLGVGCLVAWKVEVEKSQLGRRGPSPQERLWPPT